MFPSSPLSIVGRRGRPAPVALAACLGACLTASLASCGGDSVGPGAVHQGPGLNVVAGANATDTVDAELPLALRVVVRDDAGAVMPGVVVRFTSVRLSTSDQYSQPTVLVGHVAGTGGTTFVPETTSSRGEALVRVILGSAAGAGGVKIEVPELGAETTAAFTIKPGAAKQVLLPVADTTLEVGSAMTLVGQVADRYGNARTETVSYDVGAGLTLANGRLSGAAPARARVVGKSGGLAPDTTWVSVVPVATIATRRGSGFATARLDGTNVTPITPSVEAQDPGPDWDPTGHTLLAVLGPFGGGRTLYRVGLGGSTDRLVDPAVWNAGYVYDATYSPDGQWVYVSAGTCNYAAILYRVSTATPQRVERISPTGLDECFELVNHWPSPSPDGTRLAFENQTWNRQGYSVRVMDVATKATTEIATGGQRPRWSPTGDQIAYWADNRIWVVKSDGSGRRAVSPVGHNYVAGVQWSPDGRWLLAQFTPTQGWAGTTVALLDPATGLEIPLRWTTGYGAAGLPSWKPGS